jgi:hypothetical protein
MDHHVIALLAGLVAAAIMPIIALFVPGLLKTDGALSAAKVQFFLWTEAALFAYGYLFTAHVLGRVTTKFEPHFPDNVLILMGLSITAVTAVAASKDAQPRRSPSTRAVAQLLQDAKGGLSLPKLQMLTWGLVAIGAYLYTVLKAYWAFYSACATNYPDVDTALLALVGLGQGAFVVNRFVDPDSTD